MPEFLSVVDVVFFISSLVGLTWDLTLATSGNNNPILFSAQSVPILKATKPTMERFLKVVGHGTGLRRVTGTPQVC